MPIDTKPAIWVAYIKMQLPRCQWSRSRSLLLKIEIQYPLNNFSLLWLIDTKLGACNQCNQNKGIIFSSLPSFISYSCHINTWLNRWKPGFRRIAAFLVYIVQFYKTTKTRKLYFGKKSEKLKHWKNISICFDIFLNKFFNRIGTELCLSKNLIWEPLYRFPVDYNRLSEPPMRDESCSVDNPTSQEGTRLRWMIFVWEKFYYN